MIRPSEIIRIRRSEKIRSDFPVTACKMKVKPIIINISIRNKLEVFMPQVLCAVERLDGFLYFSSRI